MPAAEGQQRWGACGADRPRRKHHLVGIAVAGAWYHQQVGIERSEAKRLNRLGVGRSSPRPIESVV